MLNICLALLFTVGIAEKIRIGSTALQRWRLEFSDEEQLMINNFLRFMRDYDKGYAGVEELRLRYSIFRSNVQREQLKSGPVDFEITEFLDQTAEELILKYGSEKFSDDTKQKDNGTATHRKAEKSSNTK